MMICSTCKEAKSETEFNTNRWVKRGFDAACKICKRDEKRRYKLKNREKVLQSGREYGRKRYHENKEKELERTRLWRESNPEKYKESCRKSAAKTYQKHKEKILQRCKEYRENNREKVKASQRAWKSKNRDKVKSNRAEYEKRYPEKSTAYRAINNAVAYGKLFKPSNCSQCGYEGHIEGHHPDYSKPLEVIWLCRECHNREHQK